MPKNLIIPLFMDIIVVAQLVVVKTNHRIHFSILILVLFRWIV